MPDDRRKRLNHRARQNSLTPRVFRGDAPLRRLFLERRNGVFLQKFLNYSAGLRKKSVTFCGDSCIKCFVLPLTVVFPVLFLFGALASATDGAATDPQRAAKLPAGQAHSPAAAPPATDSVATNPKGEDSSPRASSTKITAGRFPANQAQQQAAAARPVADREEPLAGYPFREKKYETLSLDLKAFYIFKTKRAAFYPGASLYFRHDLLNIDYGYRYSVLENASYHRPTEAELRLPLSPNLSLSLGLKNHNWSEADRYWNYGFFQPRYREDPLRPEQMGLPGVYLNYDGGGDSSFLLYGSYLTLPDISAKTFIEGKKLASKHPLSVSALEIGRGLEWNVQTVRRLEWEDVLKPALGFQARHKMRYSELSLSYIYKPSSRPHFFVETAAKHPDDLKRVPAAEEAAANADSSVAGTAGAETAPSGSPAAGPTTRPSSGGIRLPVGSVLDLSPVPAVSEGSAQASGAAAGGAALHDRAPLFAVKNLDYAFTPHHVLNIEAKMFPSPSINLIGSFTYENPQAISEESQLNKSSKTRNPQLTAAAFFQVKDEAGPKENTFFTLAYSHSLPTASKRKNQADLGRGVRFTEDRDWRNSLAVSLEHSSPLFFKGFDSAFRLNYVLDNKLYLAVWENGVNLSPAFRVYFSGDLFFRLAADAKRGAASSGISRYQKMSRVTAGAKYVF